MTRRCLVVICLLAGLSGCTDTIDSVAREYRNANNEAIDAMMMITSERQAEVMIARVFRSSTDRYAAIDRRVKGVRSNRDKEPFVREVFESAGLHLYFTELEINQQRFSLEMIRLRNLAKQYQDPEQECPNLLAVIKLDGALGPVRKELTTPEIVTYMEQFTEWSRAQAVKDYDKLYQKFKLKREAYRVKEMVTLTW